MNTENLFRMAVSLNALQYLQLDVLLYSTDCLSLKQIFCLQESTKKKKESTQCTSVHFTSQRTSEFELLPKEEGHK